MPMDEGRGKLWMDLNFAANVALLVAIGILGTAAVCRIGTAYLRGRRGREGTYESLDHREPAPPIRPSPERARGAVEIPTEPWERGRLSPRDVDRLMDAIIEKEGGQVDSFAEELLGDPRVRKALKHIKPEVREAIATEFGILLAAYAEASKTSDGEPSLVSNEVRSALMREAFRLVASQSRY